MVENASDNFIPDSKSYCNTAPAFIHAFYLFTTNNLKIVYHTHLVCVFSAHDNCSPSIALFRIQAMHHSIYIHL